MLPLVRECTQRNRQSKSMDEEIRRKLKKRYLEIRKLPRKSLLTYKPLHFAI